MIEVFAGKKYCAPLKVAKKYDVVVVGSGPAGCVAALSARRNGASVLLIEREGSLGGMMTGGSINGIGINGYRAETVSEIGRPIVVDGISMELFRRLQAAEGAPPGDPMVRHPIDSQIMVHLLDEMMEEANVDVLFHTFAFDALLEDGKVKGVAIANKSGAQLILADVVVDASADGDIAAAAGAPFDYGRPEDGRHHGGSLDLRIGGVNVERFIEYLENQPILTEEERAELEADRSRLLGAGRQPNTAISLEEGKTVVREFPVAPTDWEQVKKDIREGRQPRIFLTSTGGGPFPGRAPIKDGKYVPLPAGLDKEWIEYIKEGKVPPLMGAAAHVYPPPRFYSVGVFKHGKVRFDQMQSGVYECWFDQTSGEEISKALMYMRKINKAYFNFLKERIPGFEDAYIHQEATMVGTRESRRIVGEYIIHEDDLLSGKKFDDVIALGGPRSPDAHAVTGRWGDGVTSTNRHVWSIPYRALVPKNVDNILVAGRCISATTLALGALRDQATCMTMGEAAGAAAALCARMGVTPRELDVKLLQKALLKQNVILFLDDEKEKKEEILNYQP
ncbi:MAG: FAD-dependent oxidoreductase [Firmicutes bacterium]|nr:FAD-dependent oxidoreductase [Bacillota bacterium]